VAWGFAIVLDVEIFQVHEIIEKCKNHDTRWECPGFQPGPAFRWKYYYVVVFAFFHRKKAIAYTDLLGGVILFL